MVLSFMERFHEVDLSLFKLFDPLLVLLRYLNGAESLLVTSVFRFLESLGVVSEFSLLCHLLSIVNTCDAVIPHLILRLLFQRIYKVHIIHALLLLSPIIDVLIKNHLPSFINRLFSFFFQSSVSCSCV